MKNKTIYYVGNFGKPYDNAAGKRVYGNAKCLEEIGYDVVLIGKVKTDQPYDIPVRISEHIFYYAFPNYGFVFINKYTDFVTKIMKIRADNAVAVIRYGSPTLALFDLLLLNNCAKLGIPVIADVVDWLPAYSNNVLFNIIKNIDTYIEKAIFNSRSKFVITISSFLSEYYKKKGCNTIIIPPLVDSYYKNTACNSIVTIVYAGMPFNLGTKIKESNKVKDRLDLTVESLGIIASKGIEFIFKIYGITKEEYLIAYPEHKSIIDNSSNKIQFWGRCSMEDTINAVSEADYCILLRDKNHWTQAGFPTKVVEGLSHGTPIITTKTSDLENYISDGHNGFFININDINCTVYALTEIITKKFESIKHMKDYCFLRQDFMYTKYISGLENYISEALDQ